MLLCDWSGALLLSRRQLCSASKSSNSPTSLDSRAEYFIRLGCPIHIDQTQSSTHSSSTPATPTDMAPSQGVGLRAKYSIFPSKYISRHNLRYRGAETVGEVASRGSLDLVHFPSHRESSSPPKNLTRESSWRPLFWAFTSFIGENRLSFLRGHHHEGFTTSSHFH